MIPLSALRLLAISFLSLLRYKTLLRRAETELPARWQDHYKNYIRQGFSSHSDEDDPERINLMAERALEDAQWIVEKYEKSAKEDAAAEAGTQEGAAWGSAFGDASSGDGEFPEAEKSERVNRRRKGYSDLM